MHKRYNRYLTQLIENDSQLTLADIQALTRPTHTPETKWQSRGKDNSVRDYIAHRFPGKSKNLSANISRRLDEMRDDKMREIFMTLDQIDHHMEYVATKNGVDYINDSKSTNVNSSWFSLEQMKKETVLILGGQDIDPHYEELIPLIQEKVRSLVCLGADNAHIYKLFKPFVKNIFDTHSMDDAVSTAKIAACSDEIVLLSPASASFDLFKNYEDRGNKFKQAVRQLHDAA